MAPRILIIDRNEAFTTMLEQMLSTDGGYDVQAVHSGRDALAVLQTANFDLTILDVDLGPQGMEYQALIQSVRRIRPAMRFMLIPLMGADLPPEAGELDIQGMLTKPFFADDLLPGIKKALTRRVSRPQPARPTERPTPGAPKTKPANRPALTGPAAAPEDTKARPGLRSVLTELARETAADSVLLLSIGAAGPRVVAHVSALGAKRIDEFAALIYDSIRAAQEVAGFLEQSEAPFEHNMLEGSRLRVYALALSAELLLVVVTPIGTPLGTIRHNLRRARRDLALT